MTKTLQAVSRYRNSTLGMNWPAGKVDAFTDELANYLMRDAPGVFIEVDPEALAAAEAARQAAIEAAYPVEPLPQGEVLPEPEPEPEPEDDGLEELSLQELRELAERSQIALAGLRRKQDVLDAIRAQQG